jgi:hypothetical protein
VYEFVAVSGKQYRLFVSGISFDASGDYSLSMKQYNRPANDICANAVKMTTFPHEVVGGNLLGATQDFTTASVCGDVEYSGEFHPFYRFLLYLERSYTRHIQAFGTHLLGQESLSRLN